MFAATRGGGTALDPNAVFYVGSASGTTSVSLSGLGLQQGDIVIAATGWANYSDPSPAAPSVTTSGYTNVLTSTVGPSASLRARLWIGYKVMGVTPDSSVTATSCNILQGVATNTLVHVWRRIDSSSPLAATTVSTTGVSPTTTVNSPSITPSAPAIVLSVALCSTDDSVYAAPSGMSNFANRNSYVGDAGSTVGAASVYVTGAYDPAAYAGVVNVWIAATLALKLA